MGKLALTGGAPLRTAAYPEWPVVGPEERENLLRVFDSGKWWFGETIKEFERAYADFHDAKYGVACTNGSASLEMGLRACGVKAGDEVIVPAYTFVATPNSVMQVNAIPIFADIDPDTANLDLADVERKISEKTRAIMPVHFAGLPVDMDALNALAQQHNLAIIEDACHSWGAKWKGKGTGALGNCGGFSFQMSKNITAGEGGIMLTDDAEIADTAANYMHYGRAKGGGFYDHFTLGNNFRMTELQAAILLGMLTRLEEQTLKREANARYLDHQLDGIPGISYMRGDARVTRRAYHLYIMRFHAEEWPGLTRDRFLEAVKAEGAPVWAGYPHPLYKNPLFQRPQGEGPEFCPHSCPFYGKTVDYTQMICPGAEQICADSIWIGHPVLLAEEQDMQDIADCIVKVRENMSELIDG